MAKKVTGHQPRKLPPKIEFEFLIHISLPERYEGRTSRDPRTNRGFYAKGCEVRFVYDGGQGWGTKDTVVLFCADIVGLDGETLIEGANLARQLAKHFNVERKRAKKDIS